MFQKEIKHLHKTPLFMLFTNYYYFLLWNYCSGSEHSYQVLL